MQPRRLLSLHCAAPADLAALADLALWCQAYTPLTAPDPPWGAAGHYRLRAFVRR
jgi:protein ImuB